MVDTETKKVMDYNVTDTAKRYFGKLNEEFHKGIMEPGAFNATYDQYLDKRGNVVAWCENVGLAPC